MKSITKSVLISVLKPHEAVDGEKVTILASEFAQGVVLRNPIIVARESMVILDGHHRVAAYVKRGEKMISAVLVDYFSNDVQVSLRRGDIECRLIKESVLQRAQSGNVFPVKTTRHIIQYNRDYKG